MNVLSVLHFPVFGGPHNRNARVGRLLKNKGVNTILLLPDSAVDAANRVREMGCEVTQLPLSRLRKTLNPLEHIRFVTRFVRDVRAIRELIRDRAVDVVVVNGLMNPHAAIAASREGIPVVWQILDSFPPLWVQGLMRPFVRRLARIVMSTGSRVAESHLRRPSKHVPTVLFNPPVDLAVFALDQSMRGRARRQLGFGPGDFVVGNVANVNPMKGHRTFVQAAIALKSQMPLVKFVILGQTYAHHTEYANTVMQVARAAGLELGRDIQIVDPGADIAALIQALDLYWCTSEPRAEGISTAAQEAMAVGIPVISTDSGSMSEIVISGRTGYLVAPHDVRAIVERSAQIMGDDSLRHMLSENCRTLAEECFGLERCAELHLAAYRSCMDQTFNLPTEAVWR